MACDYAVVYCGRTASSPGLYGSMGRPWGLLQGIYLSWWDSGPCILGCFDGLVLWSVKPVLLADFSFIESELKSLLFRAEPSGRRWQNDRAASALYRLLGGQESNAPQHHGPDVRHRKLFNRSSHRGIGERLSVVSVHREMVNKSRVDSNVDTH